MQVTGVEGFRAVSLGRMFSICFGGIGAYSKHLDRLGAIRLPVAEDHALLAGRLEWDHRYPFDRMLAAQAMIESLVLVTGDSTFSGCRGVPTLW